MVKKMNVTPSSNFRETSFNDMLRDAVDPEEAAAPAPAPAQEASKSQELDKSARQKGDGLVYGYYIKSFGILAFILWFILVVIASSSSRLPSELCPGSRRRTNTELIRETGVFIRVWLDKAPSNNLYFIGFAGIALGHVFLVFVSAVYVSVTF